MRYRIVLVPFPFDDFSGTKLRPAAILTQPVGRYQHIVVAFITSVVARPPEASDIFLDPSASDMPASGLRHASQLRLHRLVSIPVALIRRSLGILPARIHGEISTKLNHLFSA
jgi:mRNA interferase MazF